MTITQKRAIGVSKYKAVNTTHAGMTFDSKSEREHTPHELAEWLVELARRCRVGVTA